tara:strand:- start:979 stop:1431 length:453 start_codon:yes stop_codon:yes gene_type:complete
MMNIQELEIKCAELGAEIQRLKRQPQGVWEPSLGGTFWMVDWSGGVRGLNPNSRAAVSHHNVYKNESLARKASVLQRRANLIIQACLNFEPDFVPDWSNGDEIKYGPYYDHISQKWCYSRTYVTDDSAAYVSTQAISAKVLTYLNSQEIK